MLKSVQQLNISELLKRMYSVKTPQEAKNFYDDISKFMRDGKLDSEGILEISKKITPEIYKLYNEWWAEHFKLAPDKKS